MGVGLFYTRTPKDDGRIISVREDDWSEEQSYYLRIYQNKETRSLKMDILSISNIKT